MLLPPSAELLQILAKRCPEYFVEGNSKENTKEVSEKKDHSHRLQRKRSLPEIMSRKMSL